MRILGIDPGTVNLGYGVVDDGQEMRMVDYGVLSLSRYARLEERLRSIYDGLSQIVAKHHPDEVAIEEPFAGCNIHSALAIGRAQAIAILVAANQRLPVHCYSPAQIKQQVTSYGGSDKKQVQEGVRMLLGLQESPQPSDASDALAVAICHIQQSRLDKLLANEG
ncbi:MAG: crossover junction endodeoxyribonuclease RuvC [Dehalococcoidia bacterium CG2_30_46_19]|jgi:crossover junction endodeoxyribonuclease RuvC|nr:MAG: crossover junction endodeoxyribonuclease RuvC [Dehalococcoidia bacterium CG2_30_46_19]